MDLTLDLEFSMDLEHVFDANIKAEPEGSLQADYGEEVEVFDGAGKRWGIGQTFMDQFSENEYVAERKENPHWPFASEPDWEMALFLLQSNLSMADIYKYLKLEFVSSSV
ncbi:hypothetical protein BDR03DRAFT_1015117 [Suillus americanus]|nr:hypothetical protein BDR03DRAFT_1015117 [Suillus americanus]